MKTKAKNFAQQLKEHTGFVSDFMEELMAEGHKFTPEQVVALTAKGIDNPHYIVGNLAENGQPELISDELINVCIKEGYQAHIINALPEEMVTAELVAKCMESDAYNTLRELKGCSVRDNLLHLVTREQAIAAVKEGAYHLGYLPYKLIDEEIAFIAIKSGCDSPRYIPSDIMTLEMFILMGKNNSFHYERNYTDFLKDLDKSWGVTKKDMKALLKEGCKLSLSKVDYDDTVAVEAAMWKVILDKRPDRIKEMPEPLIDIMTPSEAIEAIDNFNHQTWTGYRHIQYLSEDNQNNPEVIEFVQEKFRDFTSTPLEFIPKHMITVEMCNVAVLNDGSNLESVPSEFMTKTLCKEAVTQSGKNLDYVPDEFKGEFYVDVAKTGYGLDTIPEDHRTDMICSIAVEKNGMQLEFVPDDKKSYSLMLAAVSQTYEAYSLLPEGVEGSYEFRVRAFTQYLQEGDCWSPKRKLEDIFPDHKFQAEVALEVVKRNPELFPKIVEVTNRDTSFEYLLAGDVCLEAFKGDNNNAGYIPTKQLIELLKQI
jgi:hypothetical protein